MASDADRRTDEELLVCASSGDKPAREILFKRYLSALVLRALPRVRDQHIATQIAHDSLLAAERDFDPSKGRFQPRLLTCFSRRCIDYYRSTNYIPAPVDIDEEVVHLHPRADFAQEIVDLIWIQDLERRARAQIAELRDDALRARRESVLDVFFAEYSLETSERRIVYELWQELAILFECDEAQISRDRRWITDIIRRLIQRDLEMEPDEVEKGVRP